MAGLTDRVLAGVSWGYVLGGVALFLASLAISLVVIGTLLVLLPSTYFLDSHDRGLWIDQHPVVRWSGIVAKNALGVVIVVIGVALSLPGIPGQGLLTILIGLVLIDFPGKRKLERRILRMPRVLKRVNNLRRRYGKSPLVLEDPTGKDPRTDSPHSEEPS
jgi:hypothetical protein